MKHKSISSFSPLKLICILLCYFVHNSNCANILVYGIIGSHSTRISMWPYMEALADKGHNVTYLSPFASYEESEKRSKIKPFIPKKWLEVLGSWDQQMGFYDIRKNNLLPAMWYGLRHMGVLSCEALYSDPEFLEWIKTTPKFDLVIAEASANECAYGLVRLWNAKLAVYSVTTVVPWMADQYGLPEESSSISDTILNYAPWKEMTFLQRIVNALCPIVFALTWEYEYLPKLEQVTRKGLGLTAEENEQLPRFMDVARNVSLVLLTSHFSLDFPRSLPPHVIQIGGIAMAKKTKPSPKDIQDFINSANSGFIYISFGTVADFTTFDEAVQREFVNALKHFPETKFVWTLSKDLNNITLSSNILVSKWAPQQTILENPKLRAFITHAGMGSTTEAIHNSVPVICIPVLAEQDFNANTLVSRGAGVMVEITTLKENELKNAIQEVLDNPKYRLAMKQLNTVYKEFQHSPLERALNYTEFILEHENSNDFLRPTPSVRQQPWWKRRQIDVWLTVSLAFITTAVLSLYILYFFISKLITRNVTKENSVKRKKD